MCAYNTLVLCETQCFLLFVSSIPGLWCGVSEWRGGHYYSSGYQGGGGAAGRIAVYFALNRTFSGSFEAHGGSSGGANAGHGGPGTMFFYHTGTSSLILLFHWVYR